MRRRAMEDRCELLLRTPPDQRVRKIRRARRRFRSFLLAEMLIEECRRRVRNEPAVALAVVDLVPHVLAWTRKRVAPPQANDLLARASAHRANALRVAGDLPAAEREFIALRSRLALHPVADPSAEADVASLEASLFIGQRRFEEADALLGRATLAAHQAGADETLARIYLQHANLQETCGRPAEVLELFEAAGDLLDAAAEPIHFLCTVTGRVNALCDLDRAEEAHRLLRRHAGYYESSEGPFAGSIYRFLLGRCALGRGDAAAAEEALTASRDAFLALGRAYDAALIALYLTEALFLAGKMAEVRSLAAQLIPVFRSRGIQGGALAALRQLARATSREAVTAGVLAEIRRLASGAGASTSSH